tara:strand:+ start:1249 stop:1893 length:645 start_codon:yes stop_codon:yes gene_type:complete
MNHRKIQSKRRYLKSFIFATIVFGVIFLLSYGVSYIELSRMNHLQQTLSYDIFSDKLDYSLFEKNNCELESYNKISKSLAIQGKIINDLEKKFGKNDEKVIFRKQFYTLILIEHFEFVKDRNQNCEDFVNNILFFYSNLEDDLDSGEKIGRLLGTVHAKTDNLVIYSFDINLESNLINNLREKYGVIRKNTLVINENILIENPAHISEIEANLK